MSIIFGSPEAKALVEQLRKSRIQEEQDKELAGQVIDIPARIEELEDDIADAQSEIHSLEYRLAGYEEDIENYESELAALRRIQQAKESEPDKATYIEQPTLTPRLI